MNGNPTPYDWNEAREVINGAKAAQAAAEDAVKRAFRDFGKAREVYQLAFAEEILRQKVEHGATVALELARGNKKVADLRFKKDVAEGVVEASKAALWRHTANRKDVARLVDWSRGVAPDGQEDEPRLVGGAV